MIRLKCNSCGRVEEGTIGELQNKGWRQVSRTKNGRVKTITECPEHNGVMAGRER